MMVKVVKVGNATFPIGNYITPGGMCISLYESYYFYLHSFISSVITIIMGFLTLIFQNRFSNSVLFRNFAAKL